MDARLMLGSEVVAHLSPQAHVHAEEVRRHCVPTLAALLAVSDAATEAYLRHKARMCREFGFPFELIRLPESASKEHVMGLIRERSGAPHVHGILPQLPLSPSLEAVKYELFDAIAPEKDVDALSAPNVVELYRGKLGLFIPATVRAVLQMLLCYGISTTGKRVLVIGRNDITGKPLALILGGRAGAAFAESLGNAEVVWCNKHTPDPYLREEVRRAEIVVSCAGVDPHGLGRDYLIPGEDVREGAVVIDVGMRRQDGRLVGDVDFQAARHRAAFVTPVPGGVGPVTVISLVQNLIDAARYSLGMGRASYDCRPSR